MSDMDAHSRAEVARIVRAHLGGQEIRLVGSRARGTAKRFADIDVLVMNREPLSPSARALINTAFEESDLPYKVDLLEWASLTPAFRDRLLRDSVPLCPTACQTKV